MGDTYEECLLLVTGETVSLNTFDKIFRSGYGPQWSDRPRSHTAHYSFHALFPVPEAVQRRGFDAAGRLWCKEYWESSDDLLDMQQPAGGRIPGGRGRSQPIRRLERPLAPAQYQTVSLRR